MPYKNRLWVMGLCMFIGFSLLNFAALSLAPASILLPLEAIQFVSNVCYAAIVHQKPVPWLMRSGVVLALLGTFCTVMFGSKESSCYSMQRFEDAWTSSWSWWVYLGASIGVAALAGLMWRSYSSDVAAGRRPWRCEVVLPVTFTLVAALLGGSQLIVNSKVFSESLSMLFHGDPNVLTSWVFYVGLVGAIAGGLIWVGALTACLSLYDPLIILPLMVASFIVFGSIAGGIYFDEFGTIGYRLGTSPVAVGLGWLGYVGGMVLVLCGLLAIAVSGTAQEAEYAADVKASPLESSAKGSGVTYWRRLALVTRASSALRSSTAAHLPYSHPLTAAWNISMSRRISRQAEPSTEATPLQKASHA